MKRILVQTAATVAVLGLGGLVLAGATTPKAIAQANGAVGVAPGTAFRQTPAASATACAASCGAERSCLSWSWAAGSQVRRDRFSEPQVTPGICAMSQTRTPPAIQGSWSVVSGLPAATSAVQQPAYAGSASSLPASSGRAGGGYWEVQPLTRRQGGEAVTLTTDIAQGPVRSTQSATAPVVSAPVQRAAPAQPALVQPAPVQQSPVQQVAPVQAGRGGVAFVPPATTQPAPSQGMPRQMAAVPPAPPRPVPPVLTAPAAPPMLAAPPAPMVPPQAAPRAIPQPPPGTVEMPGMEAFRGADGMVDAAAWRRARMAAGANSGATEYSVSQSARAEVAGNSIPNSGVIAGSVPVESSDWGRMEQGAGRRNGDQDQAEAAAAQAEPQRRGWWPFGRRQAPVETSETAQATPDREEALEPGSPEEMQAAYLREAEQRQPAPSRGLVTRNSRGPLRAPVRQPAQAEPAQ